MASTSFNLLVLCCVVSQSHSLSSNEWFNNISTNLFNLSGDIMLGGLFPISLLTSNLSERTEPDKITCGSLDWFGLGLSIVMKYAIDEVNANPALLPGVKLGYKIYNTCRQPAVIVQPTLSFLTNRSTEELSVECNYTDYDTSISAVIGPYSSEMVSIIGKLLGFFLMPQISYGATSDKFSDKTTYPSFFRTVPSDKWQVDVMMQLIQEFEWNWVAVVGSEEEYGQMGAQEFSKLAEKSSVCVAYQGLIPVYTDPGPTIEVIISNIKATNVNVIVVFSLVEPALVFFTKVMEHNLTCVWIGSTSWTNSRKLTSIPKMKTIGTIIGFTDMTQDLPYLTDYTQALFTKISEESKNSKQPPNNNNNNNNPSEPCPQCWRLSPANTSRIQDSGVKGQAFSVYAAVYSVAEALHQLLHCDETRCDWKRGSTKVYPWKLMQVLKNISIDINGTKFHFDSTGNPNVGYQVIQWNWEDSNVQLRNVGSFQHNLTINKSLFTWHTEDSTVPISTCSSDCKPGQVRRVKGFHSCCFDCIDCQPGTYQASREDIKCTTCPKGLWSTLRSSSCTQPTFEVLSWDRTESVLMVLAGTLLLLFQSSVLLLFLRHRTTPLVLASGGTMAIVALLSLMGACLSLVLFLGQPTDIVCRLQLPLTSIWQTVTLSIITSISLQVFFVSEFPERTAPHLRTIRGPGSWLLVLSCCVAQAGICGWFVQEGPSLSVYMENMEINFVEAFLTCPVEPLIGLALLQGFNVVLALVSFMCTFMAVKPLHQYNLSRDITFACLIYCVIWVSFIPIYIGLQDMMKSIVHVSFTLSSNFGLMAAYYLPKCYLIVRKPELNKPEYFCTVLEGAPPTPPQDEPQPKTEETETAESVH
ncbi:taste receptor type 1 member 3 [Eucyclogobius newberryi]|uniref:taste receptor type 1 member 3 n=1 Tax=Eucyclogobius newberryi TaxID=166745 RepID=UPI003B5C9EAB